MAKQSREQRERHVVALLETLNDPYALPRHESAEAGPAASRRVPCEGCNRTGRVVVTYTFPPYGTGLHPCPACGGSGMRRRRKGDQAFDEYLNQPVSEATSSLKTPPRQFKLDEDIRRLWFELKRLERVDEPEPDILLKALKAKGWLEKRGSYRELRRALAALEERSPCVYGAIYRRFLRGVEPETSARFDTLVEIGVAFLAGQIPDDPIRVPHAFQQAAAETRTVSVRELAERGLGARKIARELGMPLYKVKTILRDTVRVTPSDAPGTFQEAESASGLESGA